MVVHLWGRGSSSCLRNIKKRCHGMLGRTRFGHLISRYRHSHVYAFSPAQTFFTSEHVSPGHPDKVMDTIAESFVDFAIKKQTTTRGRLDGLVKNNLIFLAGELTTPGKFDVDAIVKKALRQTGYDQSSYGFAWNPVFNSETVKDDGRLFNQHTPAGVDKKETGSGDIRYYVWWSCTRSPARPPAGRTICPGFYLTRAF